MTPVILIELSEAVALSTEERDLFISPRPVHQLPAVVGKLLAQRVQFGHETRSYDDYLHDDDGRSPAPEDYQRVGDFLGSMRKGVAQQIKDAQSALRAQPALIFQSFHEFIAELKKQQATVVLRYPPHVAAEALLQELEFFHDLKLQRGSWKQGQLSYDNEPVVEMKEALGEGFHAWADEELAVPLPRGIPNLIFAVREAYRCDTWRDPISVAMVKTREPVTEVLLAQERGQLILVDPWRALTEPQYYQKCYQDALLARADGDLREKSWRVQQEKQDTMFHGRLQDAMDYLHRPRSERDVAWSLRDWSSIQQSQFYHLLRGYIQNLPPDEWAKLHFARVAVPAEPAVAPLSAACSSSSAAPRTRAPRVLCTSSFRTEAEAEAAGLARTRRRFKVRRGQVVAPTEEPASAAMAPAEEPAFMELC
jgi:hypothetical protein